MRFLLFSILHFSFVTSFVNAQEFDFDVSITAQGSIGQKQSFSSLGSGRIYSAETFLAPHGGYLTLYRDFEKEDRNNIRVGVWQKADAFQKYLSKCSISVPVESLLMRIASDEIFRSSNQKEIDQIAEEVGQHLSFEKKITFISQIGAALNESYDFNRDINGVITMMDMVNAKKNGTKAGVCRDMHAAMAQMMVKMGVPDAFVVATQIVGGAHAVLLVQDPNDPAKTYLVNYGRATSQRSADASSHLLLDSTIPSVGAFYRIYDANGKSLTTLPSGLGILLNDYLGKNPSALDPYTRSASNFVRAAVLNIQSGKHNVSLSLAAGESSDKDRVIALNAQYKSIDELFPMEMNISLYDMKRESDMRGTISGKGMYLDGVQHIRYSPVKDMRVPGGNLEMEVYGRLGVRSNAIIASEEIGSKNKFSVDMEVNSAVGSKITFQSDDNKTKASTMIEVVGALDKTDVREEGKKGMMFDLRHVTGSVVVSRELSKGTNGYTVNGEAGASVVSRPGLGMQSRQQMGITVIDEKGRTAALSLVHEGQIKGRTIAFVPGSLETYALEASISDRHRNSLSTGVFCTKVGERKSCGNRVTGKIKF